MTKQTFRPQYFHDRKVTLYTGDCRKVLKTLPANSVDAVVVDPPYHMESVIARFGKTGKRDKVRTASNPFARTAKNFIDKKWDGGDIAFRPETWKPVLRVLKPGGYLLAFSSAVKFGRMSVAIEDAGFITHQMKGWINGQGFPKGKRVISTGLSDRDRATQGWEGWRYGGQALKASIEPIYMGQKPFTAGLTGSQNIQRWGVGALNISGLSEKGWPANIMTDGSDVVAKALFDAPDIFWASKADEHDRSGSEHAAVKPIDLLQRLVRMVTPPGGVVLDCFAGTGSTGEAAIREGVNCILIEMEREFARDVRKRMKLIMTGPDERKRAITKMKDELEPVDSLPLFGSQENNSAG